MLNCSVGLISIVGRLPRALPWADQRLNPLRSLRLYVEKMASVDWKLEMGTE